MTGTAIGERVRGVGRFKPFDAERFGDLLEAVAGLFRDEVAWVAREFAAGRAAHEVRWQQEIDAERLVRHRPDLVDLGAEGVWREAGAADNAKAASVRNGGREFGNRGRGVFSRGGINVKPPFLAFCKLQRLVYWQTLVALF